MNQNCEIIRDLMPLYLDQVCSDSSGQLVKEHLSECPDCRNIFLQMKNEELEAAMIEEKEDVLKRQAGYFKRKSAVAGAVIAGIFMIPVLVCLIVNLAAGHGLTWFFIVLCSLLVAASVSVVPLMVPDNKGLWTLGCFTGSLLLLIGVVNLYTRGNTFFPAAAAILFSFAVAFLPAVIRTKPVKALDIPFKGFWVMVIDTVLFLLLLFAGTQYVGTPGLFRQGLAIALPFIGIAWLIFVIAYFPKWGKLIKAGICLIILSGTLFLADYLVNRILGTDVPFPVFSPYVWNAGTVDGNVKWIILLTGAAIGVVLIIAGIIGNVKRRK